MTRIVIVFVIVTTAFYIFSVSGVNHDREGCERLNAARVAQFAYLKGDIGARLEIIEADERSLKLLTSTNPVKAVQNAYGITLSKEVIEQSIATAKQRLATNKNFIINDREAVTNLRISAKEYRTDEGEVRVDCDRAYPYPFPLDNVR